MKTLLTLILVCGLVISSSSAQTSRTASKMLYHNGPVLTGIQDVYVIWYGCWNNCGQMGDSKTQLVVSDFLSTIGNTPYMQINLTYPNSAGVAPTGSFVYGGSVFDSYSHGYRDLTDADIQGIISDQITSFQLPHDPQGIYVVIASSDVASNETNFCTPGAPPYHGRAVIFGAMTSYIFLGNPNRCPSAAGPQFIGSAGTQLPTPHDSFAGDALASNLAHALSTTVTNPLGNAWFDRYGLENADKCQNTFGQTYLTANGATANLRLPSAGDYLIQQNWVNDRKGRCAMSP
ncbi:MAG TPA: hypothetical protein VLE19_06565 [Pyrinomonadaceae bacterium]|nr:hypothetical protein [Pyrinomonadaceae bacterium]